MKSAFEARTFVALHLILLIRRDIATVAVGEARDDNSHALTILRKDTLHRLAQTAAGHGRELAWHAKKHEAAHLHVRGEETGSYNPY